MNNGISATADLIASFVDVEGVVLTTKVEELELV